VLVIDFIRHAQSAANACGKYSNQIDDPLSPDAYPALDRLRSRLDSIGYTEAVSSPYRRCVETAQYLLDSHPIDITVEGAIREMAMGPWDQKTQGEVAQEFKIEWQIWNSDPGALQLAGRETVDQVSQRVLGWLSSFVRQRPEGQVMVVTHVAVIRAILAYYSMTPNSDIRTIDIPNLRSFRLECRRTGSPFCKFGMI
jgi:broad specificity phosphatase PhoE